MIQNVTRISRGRWGPNLLLLLQWAWGGYCSWIERWQGLFQGETSGVERESGRQPPPQLVVQTLVREDDPASLEAEQKASRGGWESGKCLKNAIFDEEAFLYEYPCWKNSWLQEAIVNFGGRKKLGEKIFGSFLASNIGHSHLPLCKM